MNKRSKVAIFVGMFCLILWGLHGCTTLKKMGLVNEVIEPTPEFGSPDSTASVYLDCKVFYDPPHDGNIFELGDYLADALFDAIKGLEEVNGIRGANLLSDDGQSIYGNSFGVDWSGSEELIIFGDLPPGNYRLSQIMATYRDKHEESHYDHEKGKWVDEEVWSYDSTTIDIPAGVLDELSFEIQAGEPRYVGLLIVIDERGARENNQYRIEFMPKYEKKACKRLIKKYKESPWVSRWQERLAELETLYPEEQSD